MPFTRDEPQQQPESLIKQAAPIIQMVSMACFVLIWSYNTFALKETVADLKNGQASLELRCQAYSDNNRHRVEERLDPVLNDIKEQLQYLRNIMKRL